MKRDAVIIVALLVLTAAAFWPALGCGFILFDDNQYITSNDHIKRGLTADNLRWAFTTFDVANWHPLTWLSYMADYELYQMDPRGYHITNLILHALNAALLFLLFRSLTTSVWRSAAIAALWAVHPLRVESVVWVAERKDVLSMLFGLLTLLGYSRYAHGAGKRWYMLAILAFALSLMAKPLLVTLPCVMLLLDFWPLGRLRLRRIDWAAGMETVASAESSIAGVVLEKLPFFALSAGASAMTMLAQRGSHAVMPLEALPLDLRFSNAAMSYARYIGKLFWFDDLSIFYPYPDRWPVWQVAGAGAMLVVVTAVTIWRAARWPWLAVGWLWFLGTLVPMIGLLQVGNQAMADRYTYLSTMGLLVMLVWSAPAALGRIVIGRVAIGGAAACALAIMCVATMRYAALWRSTIPLFEHAVSATSNNWMAYSVLGDGYREAKRYPEALEACAAAVQIKPRFTPALCNLGNAHAAVKDYDKAVAAYKQAIEAQPDIIVSYRNLAAVYLTMGRYRDALEVATIAAGMEPENPDILFTLGMIYRRMGDHAQGIKTYQELLRLDPSHVDARYDLGVEYVAVGKVEDAVVEFKRALKGRPQFFEAQLQLGLAQAALGRGAEAIDAYRAALVIKPDDPFALNALAWLYATHPSLQVADAQQALRLSQRVMELGFSSDPNMLDTKAAAEARAGDFTHARATLERAIGIAQATRPDLVDPLRQRLDLYGRNKPYVEGGAGDASGKMMQR